jgi:hypothetical protein
MTLRIGLPQARFPELERQLYEISDPHHDRYGQYLTKEQVDELVRPDSYSAEAVDAWLAENGIPEGERIQRSRAGDWVTILVTVGQAEEMLHTVRSRPHPISAWIPLFHLFCPFLLRITCRNSTFGNTLSTAIRSSARHTIAFPSTSTHTSM